MTSPAASRSLRALLLLLPSIGSAIVAAVLWHNGGARMRPMGEPVAAPAPPPHASGGPRAMFAAGHYPLIVLSDGRREEVHSLLNIAAPMRFGDYVWNVRDIPPGRVWIRIDLSRQILSVFRAGNEIGSTVILFGAPGNPTPAGLFAVIGKARTHRSSTYEADMPYMLRLTEDGVAIHASEVMAGFASRGCIGVPLPFAKLLFEEVSRGDVVSIQQG